MNINPEIFKRYDVRGKYPEEINSENVKILVQAYIAVFKPHEIVIGHDPLKGSCDIYKPVCDEFCANGVKVFEAGEVSTPRLYFASAYYKIPQGIMITASHLGTAYTGMKAVLNGIPPTQNQIYLMRKAAIENKYIIKNGEKQADRVLLDKLDEDYSNKILSLVGNIKGTEKYKIVLDASNGPNGKTAIDILNKLDIKYEMINVDIKRTNLAHETNPKVAENRKQLTEKILECNADFGILWDGDCDRAYAVDWNGDIIPPEYIGIKIGSYLISKKLGTTMTIDVRGANAVEKEVSKIGGHVKRIEAWHVPIKFEMEKDPNIVFGMETSGHYVFRDMYRADDGLLASMMFLAAIYNEEKSLKEDLTNFRKVYKIIEEINFKTLKSEEELVKEIKATYPDGSLNDIDGITVEYPGWRFNIRSSRTEPIIRLNISGIDWNSVDTNLEKLKKLIGGEILVK